MHFTILTLFPEIFAILNHSIIKRAQDKGIIKINVVNIRDFAQDKYKTVDDRPYGGGVGMILKVDVIDRALRNVKTQMSKFKTAKTKTILLDARGTTYDQHKAQKLSSLDHLIIVAGHYEGIDARVEKLVDQVISIGDFVLTGGELPAMLMIDSITRLLPGVLKKSEALEEESFTKGILAPPQYTRPETYNNMSVPPVLLSGNPKLIEKWKQRETGKR